MCRSVFSSKGLAARTVQQHSANKLMTSKRIHTHTCQCKSYLRHFQVRVQAHASSHRQQKTQLKKIEGELPNDNIILMHKGKQLATQTNRTTNKKKER